MIFTALHVITALHVTPCLATWVNIPETSVLIRHNIMEENKAAAISRGLLSQLGARRGAARIYPCGPLFDIPQHADDLYTSLGIIAHAFFNPLS